jgi:hypothetical protein
MSRALSYADAVRTLAAAAPNKVLIALDGLVGGALLGLSATGSALALSLFDAKSEFYLDTPMARYRFRSSTFPTAPQKSITSGPFRLMRVR